MNEAAEILNQLDQCNSKYTFPMLDNGYINLAGTKLSAYCDDKRWVIIIEVIGFNYRAGGHIGISNCLHIYGNCLNCPPGTSDHNFLPLTANANSCNTFDVEEEFYLNPECADVKLRSEILSIIHERQNYLSLGIELEDETKINAFEFLRLLDGLHHDKLVATEAEIRERIPADIPRILELNEWFHPDVIRGALPSENETFKQIAMVLETGNVDYYKPTHKPNTHWKNWPNGGTL
jgi:hypothetical protein